MARKTKMNTITSPELLARVNPKNKELLNDFADYLRSVQRSETTIAAYENDIRIAFVWCLQYNDNLFFCDWTKRQVVRYQNWLLTTNENSPARIKRLKASLSSLSNYIENVLDDEYPNFRNIIHKVESPINQPTRTKTVLSDEQIEHLLGVLSDSEKYEQACVLALALCSGRRKSELLRFRVSDFSDTRLVCGGALYKSAPIKTKGRGTEGKQLECYTLAKRFKPYLDAWMEERGRLGIVSEWLFPSPKDPSEHRKVASMNAWADDYTDILGVDFYWHAMRHLTVTNFKRAGIPDTVIQQYIGWSDISMVPVYVDLDAEEQLGAYFTEDGIAAPERKSIADL